MQELSFWLHHSYVPVPSFGDISIMTRKKTIPATFDAFRFPLFFFFLKKIWYIIPHKKKV